MSTVTIGEVARDAVRNLFPGYDRILQNLGIEVVGIEECGPDRKDKILVAKDGTKIMLGILEDYIPDKSAPIESQIVVTCPLEAKKKIEQVIDEHNRDPEQNPWKLCLLQARVLMELP
jgi:hypothetical protein